MKSRAQMLQAEASLSSSVEEEEEEDADVDYGPTVNSPLLRDSSGAQHHHIYSSGRDSFHAAFLLFFLLGIGSLLPWNFFTTAKSYFDYKFRNTTAVQAGGNGTGTEAAAATYLQLTFENYLSVFSNLPNIAFMLLNAVITRHVGQAARLLAGLCVMIAVFTATSIFVCVDTDAYQQQFFWGTMASVVAVNSGGALVQGSLFGLAAMLPHRYVKALMQGQASGGVIAALVYLASLRLSSSPLSAGLVYFASATCVLLLCLLAYLALRRLPFVREHVSRSQSFSADVGSPCGAVGFSALSSPQAADASASAGGGGPWPLLCRALSDLAWPGLAVFLVFSVSLSLYPALLSSVASVANPSSLYFAPLACFLAFNAFDLVGRSLTGLARCQGPRSTRALVPLALLRLAFAPLFLLCNYQPRRQTALPLLFKSDAALPVLVCLFGLSNGYLGTLAMTRGSAAAPPGSAETYGALMSLCLTVGLGVGSAASFIFTTLL